MNIFETIRLAISSLLTNKLRSFLTMLGIIMGITAVITITTIGSSLKDFFANEFSKFGSRTVDAYLMYNYESDDSSSEFKLSSSSVEEFLENNSGFVFINSFYNRSESQTYQTFSGKDKSYNISFLEYGSYLAENVKVLKGRGLKKRDYDESKPIAVIDEKTAIELFGSAEDALGKNLNYSLLNNNINGSYYIVGIIKSDTSYNSETKIYIANSCICDEIYSYYQAMFDAYDYDVDLDSYYDLEFYYDDTVVSSDVSTIIKNYFSRYITDDSVELEVYSLNDTLTEAMSELNIVTVIVALIAGIALLVGGVGVMNIMLVSVIERTKEIGIEKALGAKNSDIRFQFIVESIVICMAGCLIGILLGLFNCWVLSKISRPIMYNLYDVNFGINVVPSYLAIVISCIFCSLVGLFFGLYPANKAAKLNPIDALRYE